MVAHICNPTLEAEAGDGDVRLALKACVVRLSITAGLVTRY